MFYFQTKAGESLMSIEVGTLILCALTSGEHTLGELMSILQKLSLGRQAFSPAAINIQLLEWKNAGFVEYEARNPLTGSTAKLKPEGRHYLLESPEMVFVRAALNRLAEENQGET